MTRVLDPCIACMLLTRLSFLAHRSSYLFAASHGYVLKYKHNNWRLSDNLLPFCPCPIRRRTHWRRSWNRCCTYIYTLYDGACIIRQRTQEFSCSVLFIFLHRFPDSFAHSIFIKCTISIDHTKRWAISDKRQATEPVMMARTQLLHNHCFKSLFCRLSLKFSYSPYILLIQ